MSQQLEPYAPTEINCYGSVERVKPGWVQVPRRLARGAPKKFTIVTGWSGYGRYTRPDLEAVVPADWWAKRQVERAAKAPKPETLRARKLGVSILEVRRRAKRQACSPDLILDRLERLISARSKRLVQDATERAALTPDYVARVATPLLAALSSEQRVARALEVTHSLNRQAKRSNPHLRGRIYQAKDRLVSALVVAGDGAVFSFSRPDTYGSCCTGVPIRSGEDCYTCGTLVVGDEVTWGLIEFAGETERYRFHVPPERVTQAMLARATPIEPHDPKQPLRDVPATGLSVEEGIAVVAHVAHQVQDGTLRLSADVLAQRENTRRRQAQERATRGQRRSV